MKEIFERIKGDFFSVMAPGFHLLVVFLILGISLAWKDPVAIDIHEVFSPTKEIYSYWPNFIIATFLAYLFGHFLRAIPIQSADKLCKKLFRWVAKLSRPRSALYYSTDFPYHKALTLLLEDLQADGYPKTCFSMPAEHTINTDFKFFKIVLCTESINAFEFTQSLENRVRLFAGMFWSSCLAVIGCLILGGSILLFGHGNWLPIHSFLAVGSLISGILLGSQLPRVRGQEVEYVFLAYLSHLAR